MTRLYPRHGWKSLLLVLLSLFLVACVGTPKPVLQPAKSPNDDNEYRYITLENNLRVLLISDPDTKKAAAAMDVLVGHGDNPPGREGLAHFLEHMLFLGTEKYPDAAEYEEYITEHGGTRNAFTSYEHTNYFFDIDEAYLPAALDRFAQFFIAPLFDAQYVDRERNAVEAEYQLGLNSDGRRGLEVLQEVMNPDHPFSQFSVGSLETLADRPGATVRDDLLAFYARHYSANQMTLSVLGSQSLDALETLVRPMFSPLPDKSFEYGDITVPVFPQGSLPMLVQVEPKATLRQLQVAFPIDDYRKDYQAKPLSYLGNLVGHEGEGSLLSQLKAEGLAEGLGAGSGLAWRGGALFSVSVTLTERGVAQHERVLQLLFAYMDMLRREGPRERLYEEQAQLADLSFRFREDVQPMGYVSSVAQGMHYYAPEDTLRGPYIMNRYDSKMLSDLMSSLVPENAMVTLNHKSVSTDRISKYYRAPYARATLSEEQLADWRAQGDSGALHLPAPNEFIAGNVDLKPVAKDNPESPRVALEGGRQRIWFIQDDEFEVPKGATYINFRSPAVGDNAGQTAAANLYTALLQDALNEYTYPALLAGLNFSLYKHARGISLRISGYDDKQQILLARILAAIKESSFDSTRFANVRTELIRGLRNVVTLRPFRQVTGDLNEALLYGEWGEDALIEALEEMDQAALSAFVEAFWRDAQAEVLIYGNYAPAVVKQISGLLDEVVPTTAAPPLPELRVLKLAAGEALQLAVDVAHDDSVVAWYLQGAGSTWEDRAATSLTAQIMKSGFFQQLRTEQQLGYVASASAVSQLDVPGLLMLIQSPTASAADVALAIDKFTRGVEQALSEEMFDRHQRALLSDILRPDKNLFMRAEFYWQSIAKKQWEFEGREALAAAVSAYSRESWLDYFKRVFMDQRRSLQVVAPGRWGVLPEGDVQLYREAGAIKAGHDAYVIE